MNTIAIFGHTGFIGKNLCNYLSDLKREVKGISIRDQHWRHEALKSVTWINLVGKAHDHKGKATEQDYYEVNLGLTKNIFKAFLVSQATLFIHVSSLAALEEVESISTLTETESCRPVSWYGKSKRAAEEWLLQQELPASKKIIILRPPMIHGADDKGNLGLLYKFILKGIPYPLASFNNKRSFISITNFCFFTDQIISNQRYISSGIYHVADDEAVSTNQIISVIQTVTGKAVLTLALPKFIIISIAKFGDLFPFPLNSMRLKKMTGNLMVSNAKIKAALGIKELPLNAIEGLTKTIGALQH